MYFGLGDLACYCCVPACFSLGLWVQNCDTTSHCLPQKAVALSTVLLRMSKWYRRDASHLLVDVGPAGNTSCSPLRIRNVHILYSIDRTNGLMCVFMHSIFNSFHVLCTGNSVSLFKCWNFCRLLCSHLKHDRADPLPPSSVHVIICLFIQQLGSLLF
jgi:hypothetical protein